MVINIRKYKSSDFEMVLSWWKDINKEVSQDTYPEESSYVFEVDGIPLLCASLYLMNSPIACMLENIISNPNNKVENREVLVNSFVTFLENEARNKGYKSIILLAYEDKLKERWSRTTGFRRISDNVSAFAKSLIGK